MNISRFVVLGTLDILGNASGYDIIRYLDSRMVSHWTSIKKGSVYNALKAALKQQDVREVERIKAGMYPTMTIYELTDAGRKAFDSLQDTAFRGLYPSYIGFKLALKFNTRRTAGEIRRYAELAIAEIDQIVGNMDIHLQSLSGETMRRQSDGFFMAHDRMLLKQERAWLELVVTALDSDGFGPLKGYVAT